MEAKDLSTYFMGSTQLALAIYGEKGCQEAALALFPDYSHVEMRVLSQLDELMVLNDMTPKQFIGVIDKYKEDFINSENHKEED